MRGMMSITYNIRWLLVGEKEFLLVFKDRLVAGNNIINNKNEIMCVSDIPFIIPRQLEDVRHATDEETTAAFERAKLFIRRMDEYLISPEDKNEAKRQRHQDTSLGLCALAAAAATIQKVSFREVLSVGETLQDATRRLSQSHVSTDNLLQQSEKIDPLTDFQEAHDLIEFDEARAQHRKALLKKKLINHQIWFI